jgi:predicted Zn-dependent protease
MSFGLRIFAAAFALLASTLADAATAQQPLTAPADVVIHLHASLQNTDFAEGLACELSRVLVAPVRTTSNDLALTRADLATATQLDAVKVRRRFVQATADQPVDQQPGRTYRYLIVPYDLKAEGVNFLFALTMVDDQAASVMSVIRLTPTEPGLSRKHVSDVLGDRLFKLTLKSVAVMSGLRSSGCVMAYPRTLEELDAKAAEFCADDRAALIAAGVLKERPFGACNTVAMAGR